MDKEKETFADFKLNKQLLQAIGEMGYESPTEIQQKAIPPLLAGQDVVGIAQTGTGKTAAYLLPLLMKVKYAQGNDPRALILLPTRELALQVAENVEKLSAFTDLRYAVVYGGVGPKSQVEEVEKGIDVLIGTPGRVVDIYATGALVFKQLHTLVLDEADRMMDMGFMPQLRKFLEILPSKKRQNMLFSATMPPMVIRLTEEFLEFPLEVEVTPQATPAETVKQEVYYVPNIKAKINLLLYFLESDVESFNRVIVFTRSKQIATNVFKYLERKIEGEVRVVHANKGQNARINSINAFKAGEVRVMVSTDVSARGIDVSMVSHVINFEVPVLHDEYVHRIGRTGRAGQTGKAITFCNEAEKWHLEKIEGLIRMEIPVSEIPEEVEIPETPFEESQEMARQVDAQKRKDNPDFLGAFHDKKERRSTPKNKSQKKGYYAKNKNQKKGRKR